MILDTFYAFKVMIVCPGASLSLSQGRSRRVAALSALGKAWSQMDVFFLRMSGIRLTAC
ncbi:hypothetical protein GCM10022394_12300 [Zobellella aerophila]|uniref:Uncharacterized protein n=1 Tax=Zobellella aerophila TaxID=870480 RepID=A0ABP6VHX6_9GAMM